MKTLKKALWVAFLGTAILANAQKDELKTLKKLYEKDVLNPTEVQTYKATLEKLQPLAQTESDKVYYNFYKVMTPLLEMTEIKDPKALIAKINLPMLKDLATGLQATLDFEKSGKKVYTDDILETRVSFAPTFAQVAYALNVDGKFKESSDLFYGTYLLDPATQGMNLYYAAILATQAQDLDTALNYFNELKRIGFTGETTNYYATNKESKVEELFGGETQRDLFIKGGTHEKPRNEKVPSKKPEIYKLTAEIYSIKKDMPNAKAAFAEAIALSPNDTELLTSEANMYYNEGDVNTYKEKVNAILEKDPNNAKLYYQLGYASLKEDEALVKQINEVINSDKVKYQALDKKRKEMYKNALPYFEKSYSIDPESVDTIEFLKFSYRVLDMQDKIKEFENK